MQTSGDEKTFFSFGQLENGIFELKKRECSHNAEDEDSKINSSNLDSSADDIYINSNIMSINIDCRGIMPEISTRPISDKIIPPPQTPETPSSLLRSAPQIPEPVDGSNDRQLKVVPNCYLYSYSWQLHDMLRINKENNELFYMSELSSGINFNNIKPLFTKKKNEAKTNIFEGKISCLSPSMDTAAVNKKHLRSDDHSKTQSRLSFNGTNFEVIASMKNNLVTTLKDQSSVDNNKVNNVIHKSSHLVTSNTSFRNNNPSSSINRHSRQIHDFSDSNNLEIMACKNMNGSSNNYESLNNGEENECMLKNGSSQMNTSEDTNAARLTYNGLKFDSHLNGELSITKTSTTNTDLTNDEIAGDGSSYHPKYFTTSPKAVDPEGIRDTNNIYNCVECTEISDLFIPIRQAQNNHHNTNESASEAIFGVCLNKDDDLTYLKIEAEDKVPKTVNSGYISAILDDSTSEIEENCAWNGNDHFLETYSTEDDDDDDFKNYIEKNYYVTDGASANIDFGKETMEVTSLMPEQINNFYKIFCTDKKLFDENASTKDYVCENNMNLRDEYTDKKLESNLINQIERSSSAHSLFSALSNSDKNLLISCGIYNEHNQNCNLSPSKNMDTLLAQQGQIERSNQLIGNSNGKISSCDSEYNNQSQSNIVSVVNNVPNMSASVTSKNNSLTPSLDDSSNVTKGEATKTTVDLKLYTKCKNKIQSISSENPSPEDIFTDTKKQKQPRTGVGIGMNPNDDINSSDNFVDSLNIQNSAHDNTVMASLTMDTVTAPSSKDSSKQPESSYVTTDSLVSAINTATTVNTASVVAEEHKTVEENSLYKLPGIRILKISNLDSPEYSKNLVQSSLLKKTTTTLTCFDCCFNSSIYDNCNTAVTYSDKSGVVSYFFIKGKEVSESISWNFYSMISKVHNSIAPSIHNSVNINLKHDQVYSKPNLFFENSSALTKSTAFNGLTLSRTHKGIYGVDNSAMFYDFDITMEKMREYFVIPSNTVANYVAVHNILPHIVGLACDNGSIYLHDTRTPNRQCMEFKMFGKYAMSCAFNNDYYLASGTENGFGMLFDIRNTSGNIGVLLPEALRKKITIKDDSSLFDIESSAELRKNNIFCNTSESTEGIIARYRYNLNDYNPILTTPNDIGINSDGDLAIRKVLFVDNKKPIFVHHHDTADILDIKTGDIYTIKLRESLLETVLKKAANKSRTDIYDVCNKAFLFASDFSYKDFSRTRSYVMKDESYIQEEKLIYMQISQSFNKTKKDIVNAFMHTPPPHILGTTKGVADDEVWFGTNFGIFGGKITYKKCN